VSFEGENDDEALLEVVAWWADVMTPPVVAEGFRGIEAAVALAEAGADFLALPVALPADARDHAVLRELSLALGEIGAEP
jgi:thiamine monophosphate synthase